MEGPGTWFEGIPGLDIRIQVPDPAWANNLCAYYCALRLFGPIPAARWYQSQHPVESRTGPYRDWLSAGKRVPDPRSGYEDGPGLLDPVDAHCRRIALALAHDTIPEDARQKDVLSYAQGLYALLATPDPQAAKFERQMERAAV